MGLDPVTRGLFAVASLAVFLAHLLRETLESKLSVFDSGLSLPPSLLGAGLDLFFPAPARPWRGPPGSGAVPGRRESRIGEEDSSQTYCRYRLTKSNACSWAFSLSFGSPPERPCPAPCTATNSCEILFSASAAAILTARA